jgi:uncharacterized protein
MTRTTLKAYYRIKPLIPRRIQLLIRRALAQVKLRTQADVWPIDEKASAPPPNWRGWPDGKRFAFLITHDVDTGKGQDNCRHLAELERSLGFTGSYNFVPERYQVREDLRNYLAENGFEVGVHGLNHDGKYYNSYKVFAERSLKINRYMREWNSVGFRSPSMLHNLKWIHALDIEYDSSTFDTDPFEPQPDGARTIYPFWVPSANGNGEGYVEIPYTMPQDFTLYVLLRHKNIDAWKRKLDWIASKGGMALMLIHPDYININEGRNGHEKYPLELYSEFLRYIHERYKGEYYHVLPRELAEFWKANYVVDLTDHRDSFVDKATKNRKIWIDMDNSPHVPFFKPIIEELSNKGFSVVLTARDCAQTCGLADQSSLRYERIGRHFGKNKLLKVCGLLIRALQLIPFVVKSRPALALSHGSRSQIVLASIWGIPTVMFFDYEYIQLIKPTWAILPEVIPDEAIKLDKGRIFRYPGIKEDVYVPDFSPNSSILSELGLNEKEFIITIRPPATNAHYHKAQSEILFNAVMDRFGQMNDVRMVLLPRNKSQETSIKTRWPDLVSKGRVIIPEQVVDGLNLIWHSDIVISGGGTMNREAAALGVPVYSIFRGEIGAVDRFLAEKGKLILLENVKDIRDKVCLEKRAVHVCPERNSNGTLEKIVNTLVTLMDREGMGA